MWKYYIYFHYRMDTGELIYVGKGANRKNYFFERAHSNDNRNILWRRIANKTYIIPEIHVFCKTNEEAQRLEKELIKCIGRRDLKTGPLVNFTDGGEGTEGMVITEELRKKRSENAKKERIGKRVRNIITGKIYNKISDAAKAEKINVGILYQYLDGTRLNKSPLMRI